MQESNNEKFKSVYLKYLSVCGAIGSIIGYIKLWGYTESLYIYQVADLKRGIMNAIALCTLMLFIFIYSTNKGKEDVNMVKMLGVAAGISILIPGWMALCVLAKVQTGLPLLGIAITYMILKQKKNEELTNKDNMSDMAKENDPNI